MTEPGTASREATVMSPLLDLEVPIIDLHLMAVLVDDYLNNLSFRKSGSHVSIEITLEQFNALFFAVNEIRNRACRVADQWRAAVEQERAEID
jgi:hypothetical protein